MNLTALIARLNSFAGLDLSDEEATDGLNEAQVQLALRSEYPRKVSATLTTTVADQSEYTLDTDFLAPMKLAVGGAPWESTDFETIQQYLRNDLWLNRDGAFAIEPDDTGTDQLVLYPAPSTATDLRFTYVYSPTALVSGPDTPGAFPDFAHNYLCYYAAAWAFRSLEDNPQLAQVWDDRFDLKVAELRRYRIRRSHRKGPISVRIVGVSA